MLILDEALNITVNYIPQFSVPVTTIFGFLAFVTSLATVAGNLLVIISFFVESTLRNLTNYFIVSLAVTNLLIGVFSMNINTTYLLLGYWPLGRIVCNLYLSLDFTTFFTFLYTVFFLTVDRFCAVVIPAKYRNWRTHNKIVTIIAATWVIISSIFFTIIIGWPYFTGHFGFTQNQCLAGFVENNIFLFTTLNIVYYWVTVVVMGGLFLGIYIVAIIRHKNKRREISNLFSMAKQTESQIGVSIDHDKTKNEISNQSRNQLKNVVEQSGSPSFSSDSDTTLKHSSIQRPNTENQDLIIINEIQSPIPGRDSPNLKTNFEIDKTENRARKSLRMIGIILGTLVLCWTPFHILQLLSQFLEINYHLSIFSYWLCYANSLFNPCCYAVTDSKFKKVLLRLLRGDFHRT